MCAFPNKKRGSLIHELKEKCTASNVHVLINYTCLAKR